MEALRPADAAELCEAVAQAAAAGEALEVRGGGSKRGYGRPARGRVLDLSALCGVLEYEPAELVLTARAATPLSEVEALLDAQGQMLAFEPVRWAGLFGVEAGGDVTVGATVGATMGATLGGTLACNLAGPRRPRAGAARDHFLGFAAANGWGDGYKAGAKVVKNVTGYDLCKLHAGALGTLSVLHEVSVKVLPRPETGRTLLAHGLDEAGAVRLMAAALNSPLEVSAAAHLPAPQARAALAEAGAGDPGGAVTALRLEGHAPSVAMRSAALERLPEGARSWLEAGASVALWRSVGEVRALAAAPDAVVWRLSVAPAAAALVAAAVRAAVPAAELLLDWGGAMPWVALPAGSDGVGEDGGAAMLRAAVARHAAGGHATLVRAPAALRERVPVFQPEPPAVAALARRVKEQFDPGHVLNPGRMWAEAAG